MSFCEHVAYQAATGVILDSRWQGGPVLTWSKSFRLEQHARVPYKLERLIFSKCRRSENLPVLHIRSSNDLTAPSCVQEYSDRHW